MAMTQTQYALSKVAEEATEIAKECHKIMHFGFNSFDPNDPKRVKNIDRLIAELHDLEGALLFLRDNSGGEFEFIHDTCTALAKYDKIARHMGYAIESGNVEPFDLEDEDE